MNRDDLLIKISFVVPVYNNQNLLARCVESLLTQSLAEIEVILLDDGSVDSSAQLCEQYAKQDTRVKFLACQHIGVSAIRNLGIAHARGIYLGFVDNDDWIKPNFAKKLWQATQNATAILACCGVQKIFAEHEKCLNYYPEDLLGEDFIRQNPNILNPVWNKIFKTEYVQRFSVRFPEKAYFAEDYAFVVMYFLVTKNLGAVSLVKEALYCYWRHPSSTMSNVHINLSKKIHNSMENVAALISFVEQHKLAKRETRLVQQIVLDYMWIRLPILMIHNSMLRYPCSNREFKHVMRTYFYYQRKYRSFLSWQLGCVRLKFLIIVNLTRCYAPLWRWLVKLTNLGVKKANKAILY